MAVIKKSNPTAGGGTTVTNLSSRTPARPAPPEPVAAPLPVPVRKGVKPSVTLATDYSEPVKSIEELTVLLYGEKKIGKTSLASMALNAVFMFFEPGGKGLRVRGNNVNNWAEFKAYIPQIIASDYRTVIIDTVDVAYDMCFKHVCKDKGISHPSEGSYGDAWNAIESEFNDALDLLMKAKGVWFLSHAEVKGFQSRYGGSYDKIVQTMSKQARSLVAGTADVIGYYGYYGDERYLTIQGSDSVDAGHRLKERFWVKGQFTVGVDVMGRPVYSGTRVQSIPMGFSEVEGWNNLVTAFNNEQDSTGDPEGRTALSEIPAVKAKGRR